MRQCKPINEVLKFPRARTRFTPAFVAVVVLSVIASHAHAQMNAEGPPVPLTGSTPLVVTVTPPGTVFMPGDTVNIIATRGEGASTLSLTSLIEGFGLSLSVLRIEAVALDGSTTTAIQDGIMIGFPAAAYDSVAGDGNGGVTAADGSRLEVDDTSLSRPQGFTEVTGIIYLQQGRNDLSNDDSFVDRYQAVTDYSPNAGNPDVTPPNPLGSVHIVTIQSNGVEEVATTLEQLLQLISAHEISIASTYTGGSFKLRVTLIENQSLGVALSDNIRNSVTVETLIPFPGIRLRIRTFLEGALQ